MTDKAGFVRLWVSKKDKAIPDPRAKTIITDGDGRLIAVLLKDRLSKVRCFIYSPKERTGKPGRTASPYNVEERRAHRAEIERLSSSSNLLSMSRKVEQPPSASGQESDGGVSPGKQRERSPSGSSSQAGPTLASVVRERTRIRRSSQGERELEHDGAILGIWAQVCYLAATTLTTTT